MCCGRSAVSNAPVQKVQHLISYAATLLRQGMLTEAAAVCKEALVQSPNNADANYICGIVCHSSGDLVKARSFLEKAIKSAPRSAEILSKLASVMENLGELNSAEKCCRNAIKNDPQYPEAYNVLGHILVDKGQLDDALKNYRNAILLDPQNESYLLNIGAVYQSLGNLDSAASAYQKAIEINPNFSPALMNLGLVYQLQQNFELSLEVLNRAEQLTPDDPEVLNAMGAVLAASKYNEEAVKKLKQAIKINPDYFTALENLSQIAANSLRDTGLLYEVAKKIYANPRLADYRPYTIDMFAKAAALDERDAAIFDAAKMYLNNDIDQPDQLEHQLLFFNCTPKLSREEIFQLHKRWGNRAEQLVMQSRKILAHTRITRSSTKIRIGYLSPDFRKHSVGYFILPIIAAHDRDTFEVYCYATKGEEDEITLKIRKHAQIFHHSNNLNDAELAKLIHDDNIDILVDLAGHTADTGVNVMAYRSAPVQMTYLGYPNTTGLTTVDYRISDPYVDVDDGTIYTENLFRLPECFLSFGSFQDQDIHKTSAFERNGYITFGSFNNIRKITQAAIRCWSDILNRVPDSRLVLKTNWLDSDFTRKNLGDEFRKYNISEDRIELLGHIVSKDSHLDYYNNIDIALDTFPYNGTTTTCEALWMGVPVVTLVGKMHAQRVSYSILKNTGLEELAAHDEREYVDLAAGLAHDLGRLGELRGEVPEKLRSSILCNPEKFTRQLEHAYREIWERYIDEQKSQG